jgi:DNA-binding response OmpR family regulator
MALRILIVEDDQRIRQSTSLALEDEGYEVEGAETAEEGLSAFAARGADLVIADLMLPEMDGFAFCRALRSRSDVPIIVVTARTDTHDVVAGLEAGADDYVTKPFVVKELAARIRAHLRRTARPGAAVGDRLTFGELSVLPDAGEVTVHGHAVHLTRTEFRLVCELAEQAGKVLKREDLLRSVWGYDYFGDSRLVDVHIRRLRTKVEDDPANPTRIVTVRGLGYKLVP